MSNLKHTPEPWTFDDINLKIKGSGDIDARTTIANVSPRMDFARGLTTQTANAKRIVECVNACEGFVNPEEAIQSLKSDLRKLQAEREKLIAFVKDVADDLGKLSTSWPKITAMNLLEEVGVHL